MEFTSDIFLLPHFVAINSSTISHPFPIQGSVGEGKFQTECDLIHRINIRTIIGFYG